MGSACENFGVKRDGFGGERMGGGLIVRLARLCVKRFLTFWRRNYFFFLNFSTHCI